MSDESVTAERLRTYLNSLSLVEQESYATRCGTTVGYLRKAISAKQRIAESTAIALDRESGGQVPVESIRPDVDWAYLRGRTKSPRTPTTRKFAT
jgi:DNA-binding transcriptional regulator YdaS (Cro superfamily)